MSGIGLGSSSSSYRYRDDISESGKTPKIFYVKFAPIFGEKKLLSIFRYLEAPTEPGHVLYGDVLLLGGRSDVHRRLRHGLPSQL